MRIVYVTHVPGNYSYFIFTLLQFFGYINNVVYLVPRKIGILSRVNELTVYVQGILCINRNFHLGLSAAINKGYKKLGIFVWLYLFAKPYPF